MNTLAHLTLNTGHLRMSPRSEVSEEAIRALDPILAAGRGICPGLPTLTIVVKQRQPGRTIILIGDLRYGTALVAVVAWEEDAALHAWHSLATLARSQSHAIGESIGALEMPATLPWLAVHLASASAFLAPDVMAAIGDLERCLAWAILAREGLSN